MTDYAATWAAADAPAEPFVGRVAILEDGVRLDGRASDREPSSRQIRGDEIEDAQRLDRASIRLDLTSGESLVVTTVLELATAYDLCDDVRALLVRARAARLEAGAHRDSATALRNQAELQIRRARRLHGGRGDR